MLANGIDRPTDSTTNESWVVRSFNGRMPGLGSVALPEWTSKGSVR